jgi:hypothetical protein
VTVEPRLGSAWISPKPFSDDAVKNQLVALQRRTPGRSREHLATPPGAASTTARMVDGAGRRASRACSSGDAAVQDHGGWYGLGVLPCAVVVDVGGSSPEGAWLFEPTPTVPTGPCRVPHAVRSKASIHPKGEHLPLGKHLLDRGGRRLTPTASSVSRKISWTLNGEVVAATSRLEDCTRFVLVAAPTVPNQTR